MAVPLSRLMFIREALAAGLVGISDGTSTHGDPMDLVLNATGHDARIKLKAAIAVIDAMTAQKQAVS